MNIRPSNSLQFGMSFDFDKSDIRRINDNNFLRLVNLSKADKLELAHLSCGVNSVGIPDINKDGKVERLKILTRANKQDFGLKSIILEVIDIFRGEKSKFTKVLRPEDINLDNIKHVVNQTTTSYKRKWLSLSLKHQIKF